MKKAEKNRLDPNRKVNFSRHRNKLTKNMENSFLLVKMILEKGRPTDQNLKSTRTKSIKRLGFRSRNKK